MLPVGNHPAHRPRLEAGEKLTAFCVKVAAFKQFKKIVRLKVTKILFDIQIEHILLVLMVEKKVVTFGRTIFY